MSKFSLDSQTREDLIAKKIDSLNGLSTDTYKAVELEQISNDKELNSELEFIESLWKNDQLSQKQKPSAQMQARFYQMLSHAQTRQSDTSDELKEQAETKPGRTSFLERLGWFQPAFQMLLLVIVFAGGWIMNRQQPASIDPQLASNNQVLQEKIDTLNVMVAMSMLKNDSAAARLAGIDYAKSSGLKNQQVMTTLLSLLNNDRSSAVRLSAVEAISGKEDMQSLKLNLIDSLTKQGSAIVQIALFELLSKSVVLSQQEIEQILTNDNLDSSVRSLINEKFVNKA
ncbi:MAG: hypothetical protein OQJ89_13020 [Kangiellaceae bacterium]|nr:hypothetical protein [Kangiellaceae bacterium]MCW8997658.1 hypothetical protein [Kangiellaceae bacterium]MCW9017885.1 hypothetical protein [Kangiellaceae bacterium]